ncbi:hypothetical protein EU545_05825 [Candidatus Thorarchaeota archaeon]|nr:MAG: hypothetical protein EU545_05825 [Candidatus Thorarchaeota archaeon]
MAEIPLPGNATRRPDRERPLGVTLLAILQFIQALVVLVAGGTILIAGSIFLPIIGTVVGVVVILFGLFVFYIGLGLWNLQSWAWSWAFIANILGVIIGIVNNFDIVGILLSVVILLYLNEPNTKAVFR